MGACFSMASIQPTKHITIRTSHHNEHHHYSNNNQHTHKSNMNQTRIDTITYDTPDQLSDYNGHINSTSTNTSNQHNHTIIDTYTAPVILISSRPDNYTENTCKRNCVVKQRNFIAYEETPAAQRRSIPDISAQLLNNQIATYKQVVSSNSIKSNHCHGTVAITAM